MSENNTTTFSEKTKISLPIRNFVIVCAAIFGMSSAWFSLMQGQKETIREIRQMKQEMIPRFEVREAFDDLGRMNSGLKVPKIPLSSSGKTVKDVAYENRTP